MIQPLFEHERVFAGYRTRILELEGEGTPILMLHGYADSADTWRLTLDRLARQGRRAIAVDLPGFAKADRLTGAPILPQLDAFAASALEYLAGRPRLPVIAVGNSLGGCVALRMAERHPARLDGVVAVAPAGLQMTRLLYLIQRDPLLRSLLALPSPASSLLIRSTVARLYRGLAFAAPAEIDRAVVSAFTSHYTDRATVARYLATARRLIPELHDPYHLDAISTRVLLVWGDRDRLAFHQGAQQVVDAVPGARLELLEGVGHCPQVEVPERFTQLVLEFADRPATAVA